MVIRIQIFFFLIGFLGILLSCGGKEETTVDHAEAEAKNPWTDSIFGQLSPEQQYNQHIIFEIPEGYQRNVDSLAEWIHSKQPGGLKFISWNPDSIRKVNAILDTIIQIKPFVYTSFHKTLDLPEYPYWSSSSTNQRLSLMKIFSRSGMNLVDLNNQFDIDREADCKWLDSLIKNLSLHPIIATFSDDKVTEQFDDFIRTITKLDQPVLLHLMNYDSIAMEKFRKSSGYLGIFIAQTQTAKINQIINDGCDMVIRNIEFADTYEEWQLPKEKEENFQNSTRRILNLKSDFIGSFQPQNLKSAIKYSRLNFAHGAVSLIKNESKLLPIRSKFTIHSADDIRISQKVRKEFNIRTDKVEFSEKAIDKLISESGIKVLVLNDSVPEAILSKLSQLDKSHSLLVCFSEPEQYEKIKGTANLLFLPNYQGLDYAIFSQQLAGAIDIKGDFVKKDSVVKGLKKDKLVLARTVPEFVGLDADTLNKIDWAVKSAMSGRAFPGCQILIAKNGSIVYDKCFGHHSYERTKLVTEFSMYDLASITKVVATTMVGMKLYELQAYELDDSLYMYLPDSLKFHLPYPSTIKDITFQELFIHQSGMPAGMNILKYMMYTSENVGRFDKFYCDLKDSAYCIEVAENFYLERDYEDSLWLQINQTWLDKSKPYKYSDVNMNTLYLMFKSIIQKDPKKFGFNQPIKELKDKNLFVEFLYNTYYKPLGMDHTRYKPLQHFNKDQCVPTENERFWRKQLLQGYVHDPNAALFGGVAGNAGMFSTTNDLAVLLQMLLNKGVYNGKRYLAAETVLKFTSRQENSHRGLGWNKPVWQSGTYGCAADASMNTFGHTGFTGTCIWVDPDSELIYIFLSNRVHPTVNNRIYQYGIRRRIHQTAFDAMLD